MVSAVTAADIMAVHSLSLQAATAESELPEKKEEKAKNEFANELEDKALKRF